MSVQEQVKEFHRAGGHLINERPTIVDHKTRVLRERLIGEEVKELFEAMAEEDLVKIADGLADILYVVYGTAVSYGLEMEPISAEVHRSNMTKFAEPGTYRQTCDETGKSLKDDAGKTLKPPGFSPPSLLPIIQQQQNHAGGNS